MSRGFHPANHGPIHDAEDAARIRREHPLATKDGLELFVGLLLHRGALCPKCFYGTKVTSKRWAKCKKCGERVERHPFPEQ